MSNGSLYLEFANATAAARARLWPSWSRLYPSLERGRWYRGWDVGQDAGGVFLDLLGDGPHIHPYHHGTRTMPDTDRTCTSSPTRPTRNANS